MPKPKPIKIRDLRRSLRKLSKQWTVQVHETSCNLMIYDERGTLRGIIWTSGDKAGKYEI